MSMTRRELIKALGAGAVANLGLWGVASEAYAKNAAHVVIVGGGFGGTTAAKYLRFADAKVKITLIEPNKEYLTCPRSNDVIAGHMEMHEITFTYDAIRSQYGVNVIHDSVVGFDAGKKQLTLAGGKKLRYDQLIVSPGIDFKYDAVEGWSKEVAESTMPHAWKAGSQTLMVRDQVQKMREGGVWVMVAPPNPFRCPPGPYERASLVAEYFQKHNPKAKVIILDAKDGFTKDTPFKKGWERLYGYGSDNSLIDWVSLSNGGRVTRVDAKTNTIYTEAGEFKADAVNFIPAQQAGALAFQMGLTDASGWCPVDRHTFESLLIKDVYVLGDASIADTMPKSGYAASSQAKVCVQAIADRLAGKAPGVPSMINVCYSLVGQDYGVSIADIFKVIDGKITKLPASGVSPITESPAQPLLEAIYQRNWHRTFVNDTFA